MPDQTRLDLAADESTGGCNARWLARFAYVEFASEAQATLAVDAAQDPGLDLRGRRLALVRAGMRPVRACAALESINA